MDKAIKRGDLVYLNFDPIVGSEQGGPRPAVVVQNDMGNKHAPTVIIAPVTSKNKKSNLPTHVKLTSHILERNSMVLLEQLKIVDKSRIDSYLQNQPNSIFCDHIFLDEGFHKGLQHRRDNRNCWIHIHGFSPFREVWRGCRNIPSVRLRDQPA